VNNDRPQLLLDAPDTGALRVRKSQAVFYAFSFFWLDGFAVPAPSTGNANR